MTQITLETFRNATQENGPGFYVAEASELGIPPGPAPLTIDVIGLGNGRPLVLDHQWNDGQCEYTQEFGSISLVLFND